MKRLLGILVLSIAIFAAYGDRAHASHPLTDCLDEVSAQNDIDMEWCSLAWPGSYSCLKAASDRYLSESNSCYLQYDTMEDR